MHSDFPDSVFVGRAFGPGKLDDELVEAAENRDLVLAFDKFYHIGVHSSLACTWRRHFCERFCLFWNKLDCQKKKHCCGGWNRSIPAKAFKCEETTESLSQRRVAFGSSASRFDQSHTSNTQFYIISLNNSTDVLTILKLN